MGCYRPEMPEWIFYVTPTISVKHIHYWIQNCSTRRHSLIKDSIDILYIHVHTYWATANRFWRKTVHLWKFIGYHKQRIANLELCMCNTLPIRCVHTETFFSTKCFFIELNCLCSIFYNQIWCNSMMPFRNWFYSRRHDLSCGIDP